MLCLSLSVLHHLLLLMYSRHSRPPALPVLWPALPCSLLWLVSLPEMFLSAGTAPSSLRLSKSHLLNDKSIDHSVLILQPPPLGISQYSRSSLTYLLFLLSKAFLPPNILKYTNLLFSVSLSPQVKEGSKMAETFPNNIAAT